MNLAIRVCCSSCWIAAVAHVVAFFAWFFTASVLSCAFRDASNGFIMQFAMYFMLILFVFVAASWLMIPVSIIVNLCAKRWLRALSAMALGALASIPIGTFVFLLKFLCKFNWDG